MSKRSFIIITSLATLLVTLPYLLAAQSGGESLVFNGFLLNPIDGNSYLSKMREGWLGQWRFTLLNSSQAPEGSYLFLFYIFLGHVSHWLGLPLIFTFHAARVLGAFFLCLMLYRFLAVYLVGSSPRTKTIGFALVSLGSGLGWLAAFLGGFTADFWVAEAYPFLSMYSNPHFPLGLALILDFFVQLHNPITRSRFSGLVLKGILLAIVMPFGVVVAGLVAGSVQLWEIIERKSPIHWWMLGFLAPGGLFLIYQYSVIQSDPVLSGWNAQNLTYTPPLWDILISFSPAFILALGVIVWAIKFGEVEKYKLLVVWLAAEIILAYVPFQLQRRFLLGYYIPLACLAAIALDWLAASGKRLSRIGVAAAVAASLISNLFIWIGGVSAAAQHQPELYYPKSIQGAFDWMLAHRQDDSVVLAAPDTSSIIPGATGWRVVYGHPYETPYADQRRREVEDIFSGEMSLVDMQQYFESLGIDTIFVGPYERDLGGNLTWTDAFDVLFDGGGVTIFKTGVNP
ncbi:MAG: hypothetical protein ACYC3P_03555 [Bellilinea sp.]